MIRNADRRRSTTRFAGTVVVGTSVMLSSVSCGAAKHSAGLSDAAKYTKTPESCTLLPPSVVGRLTGAAVNGKRIDDMSVPEIQECSWATVADANHPKSTFGQVTVYVDRGTANSVDNGVQSIEKVYGKELTGTGCTPLAGVKVDQSCVAMGSGIRLVAFRVSNLFVRVTCSVQNPDVCSGGQRSATAAMLAESVLQRL